MAIKKNLNSSINLVDMDFNSLKNSFRNYLTDQELFKDYDFTGSNLNVLMELLAYNSYKNAFFLNMALSESFLDSAQLRNSLLSHAKELNYLPRSTRSAVAKIRVTFEASGESQPYIIPKGSEFSTMIKSDSYVFTIPETITVASGNTTFTFDTEIYEGIYNKDSYIYLDGIENQRFKITNKNVDTRSITVAVYEDNAEVGDTYTLTTTLLDLTSRSKVFFLQTCETGHYEIFFGDNNLGRRPKINSTIVIDYRISKGTAGNGARVFSLGFDPTGSTEMTDSEIETLEASKNGEEEETNESIRYYAPRHFQTQERTVTASDYEIALKAQFPEINAVSVFGGEELDPPRFGKVFVAVDITDVDGLPESKKDEYYKFLKRRSPLSIEPLFMEPEIIYVAVRSWVRYNINVTSNSQTRIKTLVTDAVKNYNTNFLNDFNVTLRHSQLVADIDESDISIVSNHTQSFPYKKINPRLGLAQNITIDFKMALKNTLAKLEDSHPTTDETVIFSSPFMFNGIQCILKDDGEGTVRVVKAAGSKYVKVTNIGTINYDTGVVSLSAFEINSYNGSAIKVYATARDADISSSRNLIMQIEPDEIKVEVEGLRL